MGVRKAGSGSQHKRKPGRGVRGAAQVPIEQYDHKKKARLNNPPVGLVNTRTDVESGKSKYQYDPHLNPVLNWAGKAERLSFEIPTVSLHVHERIDARTIIETVRKTNTVDYEQISLFNAQEERRPLREEVEFYKHSKNWSNRIIAGDSLLVMNSLLQKESMGEKVQMVYFDPPYGIKYGSNFQPFVGKRDVKDKSDADLTSEPETLRAFRDTWELGIHSYLSYLRDRLLLAKDLLHISGSIFVQISEENIHLVRTLLDEIFGPENFVSMIAYTTSGGFDSSTLSRAGDYLLWYCKDKNKIKYRPLYQKKSSPVGGVSKYEQVEERDGKRRPMTPEEKRGEKPLPEGSRLFRLGDLTSQGASKSTVRQYKFGGRTHDCGPNNHWKTSVPEGMDKLAALKRITMTSTGKLAYVRYWDDFPYTSYTNLWTDIGGSVQSRDKIYCVQTGTSVIERCILMTTDPGDLIFDPTCGSGTTAVVSEQWGRRWITCDTSRVAITLAKQRLMTAHYDYYKLARPSEGIDSGLVYKTATRVTLGSLANGEAPDLVTLYDQPERDSKRARVTGPFTVEAVPAPVVQSLNDKLDLTHNIADSSIGRAGETARQQDWREELLRSGIRGKNKRMIEFVRLEVLSGTRWLNLQGEIKGTGERCFVSFGPEHAPLDQRQVELAVQEAQKFVPRSAILIFAAFQFDPEAAKDIDELSWPGTEILKAQMNPDLFTMDLKKKRSANESFWLIGQPDTRTQKIKSGDFKGMYEVVVRGFDYYNPQTGAIDSGDSGNIAMWMLDVDYDGRSLFPRQVFFPNGGANDGWKRLAKTLQSEIDEELIEQYTGTISLPFEVGDYKRVAIKIVDDRGIESLRIIELQE